MADGAFVFALPAGRTPAGYITRCTPEIAAAIADDVAQGTTPNMAAMRQGISPSRLRSWMHKGEEAYNRDATPDDYMWPYLDLYVRVMVAIGEAGSAIHQSLYRNAPMWWVTNHPEVRGEWGGETGQALLTAPPVVEADAPVVEVAAPPPTMLSNEQLAQVLTQMADIHALNHPPNLTAVPITGIGADTADYTEDTQLDEGEAAG